MTRLLLVLLIAFASVSGCSTDLGPCPDDPALEARGWLALQRSCAGSSCHTTGATGTRRNGAPSGLDWDDPDRVRDEAAWLWAEIESGEMPPASWVERVPESALTAEDRQAVHAMLACGARAQALP